MSMGFPVVSQTDKQPVFGTALKLVKNHLMASWKNCVAPLHDKTPRYKPEPNHEDLPSQPSEPTLRICTMVDGTLVLPRDVRGEFLTDVVRSPEWRKILQEFDRCFGTASQPSSEQAAAAAGDAGEPVGAAAADQTAFQWPSATAAAEWHAQWDDKVKAKFAWSPDLTGYLVEKESEAEDNLPDFHLYVEAMADVSIFPEDAFLTYGSGTWLTGAKVANFVENAPVNHRGVALLLETDLVPVVLEAWKSILNGQDCISKCLTSHHHPSDPSIRFWFQENGSDSDLQSLRKVIQKCETNGMIDFDLGGHTYTRPAQVVQGNAPDQWLAIESCHGIMISRCHCIMVSQII